MPGFPRDRPPANHRALERWILDKSHEDGIAVGRARRALSFMVVSAVLARLIDDGGHPLFVLKGGVAMELRFGIRARASKDYDAVYRAELATLEGALEQARSGGFRSSWPSATSSSRSRNRISDPRPRLACAGPRGRPR